MKTRCIEIVFCCLTLSLAGGCQNKQDHVKSSVGVVSKMATAAAKEDYMGGITIGENYLRENPGDTTVLEQTGGWPTLRDVCLHYFAEGAPSLRFLQGWAAMLFAPFDFLNRIPSFPSSLAGQSGDLRVPLGHRGGFIQHGPKFRGRVPHPCARCKGGTRCC